MFNLDRTLVLRPWFDKYVCCGDVADHCGIFFDGNATRCDDGTVEAPHDECAVSMNQRGTINDVRLFDHKLATMKCADNFC